MVSRLLLLLALVIHLVYAALPLPLPATEKADALIPSVLTLAPLAGLAWLGWKYRHQPSRWAVVSLMTAAVQSLGAMAAIGMHLRPAELHPALNVVLYLALLAPPTLVAWLARLALTTRSAEALSRTPFHVDFPLRVVEKSFWNADSVVVTDEALEIWLQRAAGEPRELAPGQKRGKVPWKVFPLAEVTAVGVRAAVPDEAPWAVLRQGPSQSVPAGDVVVVRVGDVEQVLPVEKAAKFAELVRARTGRALSSHVEQPVRELDAHVAEVLPAPDPVGPKVYPTRGPDEPLPTGPGMAARWLIGAPLAFLGIAILPLVLLLATSAGAGFLAWIGVALVAWLCVLRVPRLWVAVAFLPVPLTLMWLVIQQRWLFALALVLCPVLAGLAGAVFTRWRGTDLGGSAVEVPFRLQSGERLYVRKDSLVRTTTGLVPYAVWLADISLVQCGARSAPEAGQWQSPGGLGHAVFDSTWLRIVAGPQQWFVPTPDLRLIADLITTRAATATPAPPDDLDLAGWHRLRTWAVVKHGGGERVSKPVFGVGWQLFVAACSGTLAFLMVPLVPARIPGLVAAAIAVVVLADWARVRPRLRRAEHHPLPPGSPNWGEVRPDHAPVPGYQPWV